MTIEHDMTGTHGVFSSGSTIPSNWMNDINNTLDDKVSRTYTTTAQTINSDLTMAGFHTGFNRKKMNLDDFESVDVSASLTGATGKANQTRWELDALDGFAFKSTHVVPDDITEVTFRWLIQRGVGGSTNESYEVYCIINGTNGTPHSFSSVPVSLTEITDAAFTVTAKDRIKFYMLSDQATAFEIYIYSVEYIFSS